MVPPHHHTHCCASIVRQRLREAGAIERRLAGDRPRGLANRLSKVWSLQAQRPNVQAETASDSGWHPARGLSTELIGSHLGWAKG